MLEERRSKKPDPGEKSLGVKKKKGASKNKRPMGRREKKKQVDIGPGRLGVKRIP